MTPHSFTVQWGPVDCIHRNGDIIGYLVQYELDTFRVIYEDISGRMIHLSDLTASTSYVIEIGAFNNAGSRVFSDQHTVLTLGKNIAGRQIGSTSCCVSSVTGYKLIIVFFHLSINLAQVYHQSYMFDNILSFLYAVENPVLCAEETTSSTIFVIWTSAGSVVDSYVVMWQRATTPNEDEASATITDESTSYNITGLEAGSTYIINVTAYNTIGSAVSNTVIETLMEAG